MTPDPSNWQSAAVGHRWLLTNVRDDAGDVALKPSLREAWLDLGPDGEFGFFDSINYTSGTFTSKTPPTGPQSSTPADRGAGDAP